MPDPTFARAGTLTVHQVVAHNFRLARLAAGWTQRQASGELEPYLGFALRQAGVSAIERTRDADCPRQRNLDVAEVASFAACFGRLISWFFTPPAALCDQPMAALGADENGTPASAASLTDLAADRNCAHGQLHTAIGQVACAVDALLALADPHAVEVST